MAAFDLDASEIDALRRGWERAPEIVAEAFEPAVRQATLLAEREIRERTPTAAGTLAASIAAGSPRRTASGIEGTVSTSLSYAIPVELGTKPHWPPVRPLQDWVELKLGLRGEEAEEAARAIQRKIGHRGTEGAHMFREGLRAVRGQVERMFSEAARQALQELAAAGARP